MLNSGASKPRVKGRPGPPGPPLDPCLLSGGVYPGMCLPQCMLGYNPPPPVDRKTDRCKNIMLPQLRCRR